MAERTRNRKWVKWAAAGFIAVMLILTFFSNTIMNATLPQVTAKRVVRGTITPEITGGGMTESAGGTAEQADTAGEVAAVYVTVGDRVPAGYRLMDITPKDDGTLAGMKEQLAAMELQYTRALLESGMAGTTGNELKRLSAELTEAQKQLSRAKELQSKKAALEKEQTAAEDKLSKAQAAYRKETAAAAADLQNAQYRVNDAEAFLANAVTNLEYYQKLYGETDPENPELVAAAKVVANAEADLLAAQNVLYAAESAFAELDRAYAPAVEAAQGELDAVGAKKQKLEEQYAGVPDVFSAENQVLTIKDQIAACEASITNATISSTLADMELTHQKENIDAMKASIEVAEAKLAPRSVVAAVEGVVCELPFVAGQPYTYGDTLYSIQSQADSYILRFTAPVTLAEKAVPGTMAYLTSTDGGDYRAVLRTVGPTETGSTNMRELIFDVSGYSAQPDLWLELTLPLSSREYDLVVPVQAIYEDNSGKYVYAVDNRVTPFGSRSSIRRVAVEVLDSDANFAAVEAELSGSSYVVTLANGPIADGDRVRLGTGGFDYGSDGAMG